MHQAIHVSAGLQQSWAAKKACTERRLGTWMVLPRPISSARMPLSLLSYKPTIHLSPCNICCPTSQPDPVDSRRTRHAMHLVAKKAQLTWMLPTEIIHSTCNNYVSERSAICKKVNIVDPCHHKLAKGQFAASDTDAPTRFLTGIARCAKH